MRQENSKVKAGLAQNKQLKAGKELGYSSAHWLQSLVLKRKEWEEGMERRGREEGTENLT